MKTAPIAPQNPQRRQSAADTQDSRKEETMSNEKLTILYERLSHEDGRENESLSIENQELICKGWFLLPNTYDCGSFVVNETAVVGKEQKGLITAGNQHKRS